MAALKARVLRLLGQRVTKGGTMLEVMEREF